MPIGNGMHNQSSNANPMKPNLIPNGIPCTEVPADNEKSTPNGLPNGHLPGFNDSPFIGYIIAVHRKMVMYWFKMAIKNFNYLYYNF